MRRWAIVYSRSRRILGLWLVAMCAGIVLIRLLVPGHVLGDEAKGPREVAASAELDGVWDIQQQPIVEVEVDVRGEDDVALLRGLGYTCGVGVCTLELRDGEELALGRLGLSVRPIARAIKVSMATQAAGPAATALGEHWVYGADWDNHDIPDAPLGGGCGYWRLPSFETSGAPADATIIRVVYTVRIVHNKVSDVFAELNHWQGVDAKHLTIWNREGGEVDNGADDDAANDHDIELISRETTAYNGRLVNASWQLAVRDCAWWNTGYVDYWYLYAYYWTCDPPAAPSMPYPINSQTGVLLNVDLNWGDAAGATSYELRFGTSSPPPWYAETPTSSYDALPTLACGTTYYWQVIAKHWCGSSTPGPVWYFRTIGVPVAPSSPTPADGATNQPLDLYLSWSATFSDATSYDVYLGTNPRRPLPLLGNTTSNWWQLSYLTCNTRYYWQVEAKNECGRTASAMWEFTTTCCLPGVPSNPSPANGATQVSCQADLDWADCSGATMYDVYIGTSPSALPFLLSTPTSEQSLQQLPCGTHYWWQIVAKNSCGQTRGPVWDFTVASTPSMPTGPFPANHATGVSLDADLSWAAASPITSYAVRWGPTSPPTNTTMVTSNFLALPPLSPNTKYYWYVIAVNVDCSTSGPTWDFTTCCLPATPSGPSPANGATNQSINVDLDWADASGARSYDVYFGTSTSPPWYGITDSSSFALPPLSCSTHYYWRVVAKSACGNTGGPVWDFVTVCCAPDTPSGPSPANGSTNQSINADLDWGDTAGATSYDVYFGTSASPPLFGNTASSYYALPTLSYLTKYYWKIVAKSSCGETAGPVWNFTTGSCQTPANPAGPSPSDGASGQSIEVDLDWEDAAGATSYDVYFGTTSNPPLHGNTRSSSYALPTLSGGTRYCWKVVAKNACGNTEGPVWSFTTRAGSLNLIAYLPIVRK